MGEHAISSMSFVITAAYTVTFGNSIYLMTVGDQAFPFSLENIALDYRRLIAGSMSLIMTLRFFFGNNEYLEDVMADQSKGPWVKFYHFFFVALQSVILLVNSYSIPNATVFVFGIASLFAIEVGWYFLTMLVDKPGVLPADKRKRASFFRAEMVNLAFVVGVVALSLVFSAREVWWLLGAFVLFLGNSAYDAAKNMPAYMGSISRI